MQQQVSESTNNDDDSNGFTVTVLHSLEDCMPEIIAS